MAQLTNQQARSARAIRSAQMIQCLRKDLIYCEKRPRDLLFEVIAKILEAADESIMLSRLAREAAVEARLDVTVPDTNWEITSKALLNAMLRARVLINGNGAVIEDGVGSLASQVVGLKPDFELATEAYMLEFLIYKLGDVCVRDHKALAHALFRQFDATVSMDDLEDKVAMLLATLTGSVRLDEEGYYSVTNLLKRPDVAAVS